MSDVRRWYIYLVSLISLQAVAWGIISLLWNLLVYNQNSSISSSTEALSWQIAIIIVGLPLYLVHWLWAQRLARQDEEEQESWVRSFYLYGVMASFLVSIVVNMYELLDLAFQLFIKIERRSLLDQLSTRQTGLYHVIPILILAVLWFYHYRLTVNNPHTVGAMQTARRFYMFGFAAAGLAMMTSAIILLLRWILIDAGRTAVLSTNATLPAGLTRLLIGLILWFIFWRWAQQLFRQPDKNEQASTLRKFYLYVVIFVTALTAVANATGILANILLRLLGQPSQGGDIREPIIYIIVSAILWFYHANVLQQDIRASQELSKQSAIRRIYWYLIASLGLTAFLVGFGGNISVLIHSISNSFIAELREQMAWFTAALVAGLPLWLLPWRQAQAAAMATDEAGEDERASIVRKIYLYFFIFVATMTMLGSAVYIVYRLVSLMLGATTTNNLGAELSHAIAYALMAVAVWVYHGTILRNDNRSQSTLHLPDSLRVVIVDEENGRIGQPILQALQQALPFATLQAVGFPTAANNQTLEPIFAEAELIISPWPINPNSTEMTTAVLHSPAHKLFIPAISESWEWIGIEQWNLKKVVKETTQASRQIASGRTVRQQRPHTIGTIIGIIAGMIGLLIILSSLLSFFFNYLF